MRKIMIVRFFVGMLLGFQVLVANALTPVTMCAFTLMGEGGPDYQILKDYQAEALNWMPSVRISAWFWLREVIVNLTTTSKYM